MKRKDFVWLMNAIMLFSGMYIFFMVLDSESRTIYLFFGIIFGSVITSEILGNIYAANHKQKKAVKKATSKQNVKTNTNKATATKDKTKQEIIMSDLADLNGRDFEKLVAMYYESKGYKAEITKVSGDYGVDIVLVDPKENYKIAVQCKHWKTNNVGIDAIQRLNSGKKAYGCIDAWCITTNNYTKSAKEAAELHNVIIYNKLHVHDKIIKWQLDKRKKIEVNK